jgi:hypothetical protein
MTSNVWLLMEFADNCSNLTPSPRVFSRSSSPDAAISALGQNSHAYQINDYINILSSWQRSKLACALRERVRARLLISADCSLSLMSKSEKESLCIYLCVYLWARAQPPVRCFLIPLSAAGASARATREPLEITQVIDRKTQCNIL